jgi:acetate kinase
VKILALNPGSSTLKADYWELHEPPSTVRAPAPAWSARADWKGDTADTLRGAFESLPAGVDIAGVRVVHGGPEFRESTRITPEVAAAIERLIPLAPAHNGIALETIRAVEGIFAGKLPLVAVFDTAFHAHLPPAAYVYPGPYEWLEQGIRRFGFHGTSHHYVTERAAELLGRDVRELRLISCHLGNGCSLAAVRDGRSVDTTMGYTPMDGLMMGSRSGSIDPGISVHLLRSGYTADRLDQVLNRESGLKGVSGVSHDMRAVMDAAAHGNERARLAFDIYVHRLRAGIGAMLASLGGVDALIFTAGVGENWPRVRAAACEAFAFLGWRLDDAKNAANPEDADVAAPDSTVRVLVVRTQEEWQIARECYRIPYA